MLEVPPTSDFDGAAGEFTDDVAEGRPPSVVPTLSEDERTLSAEDEEFVAYNGWGGCSQHGAVVDADELGARFAESACLSVTDQIVFHIISFFSFFVSARGFVSLASVNGRTVGNGGISRSANACKYWVKWGFPTVGNGVGNERLIQAQSSA